MKLSIKVYTIFLFSFLMFLSACAGHSGNEDPGVQDIQPGERSVIQPPSGNTPSDGARQIEERNI